MAVVGVLHAVRAGGLDAFPLRAELDDGRVGLEAVAGQLAAPLIGRAVAVLAVEQVADAEELQGVLPLMADCSDLR